MSCVQLANVAHAASPTEVLDLLRRISPGESKTSWQRYGGLALRQAVEINGDVNVLKALVEHPEIDVNACDEFGRTALHLAVIRDAADLVEFLLTREDVYVNACALFDITPLHLAARLGCTKVLPGLLHDQRVRLDVKTVHEHTALHLVVEGADANSHLSKRRSLPERSEALAMLVRKLEERNMLAVLSARDNMGRLPLHYVAEHGHIELLDSRMLNETDIHAFDHRGFSPLHFAARAGRKDILATFLQFPSINANIGTLETLFDVHISPMVKSCEYPCKCHKFSLITPVEPPIETTHNLTPLQLAARDGNISNVGALLSCRGITTIYNEHGNPLDNTVDEINVNVDDSKGLSALHYAAREGHKEVVHMILSHQPQPDVNGRDTEGLIPLMHAVTRGHVEIVEELWNVQNVQFEEFWNAQSVRFEERWDAQSVRFEEGWDAQNVHFDVVDFTTGSLACATDDSFHQKVACLLLEKLENSQQIARYLESRLSENLAHWAARYAKDLQLLSHILKWKPEYVNAKDEKFGRTPLHVAVIYSNLNAAEALCLGNGCEVVQGNAVDSSGNRAYDYAIHGSAEGSSGNRPYDSPLRFLRSSHGPSHHAWNYLERSHNRAYDHAIQSDICNVLLRRQDVKSMVDRDNNLRHTYVSASNAVLIGGALLATITYVGWLQPPLGFTPDSHVVEPFPAPANTHPNYVSLESDLAWFFILNSISFFCSIGSVLAGVATVFPTSHVSRFLPPLQVARLSLDIACLFLLAATSCALASFAIAGFAVLPPESRTTKHSLLIVTSLGGSLLWYSVWGFFLSTFWQEVTYWHFYFCSKPQLHQLMFFSSLLGPFFQLFIKFKRF